MPSEFWTRELLQLAHAEPAIWHATLALGALQQRRDLRAPVSSSTHALDNQVMENHALAITHGRNLKDPAKLLALSLALVSVTNMTGRYKESQVHIGAAHRLLRQTQNNPTTKSAAEILTRLDLQAMTFSDSSAPYSFQDASWLTKVDLDLRNGEKIESYGQAGTMLFALARRVLMYDEALAFGKLEEGQMGPVADEIMQDVTTWELKMGFFERRNRPESESWALSVRMYHTLLRLMLIATFFGPERRWDKSLGYFERIIACAKSLIAATERTETRNLMSLEPGLIIPLFLTTTKCRHSQVRRLAAKLLHQLKKQEGLWPSDGAVAVGERVMAIEEEWLPDEIRHGIELMGEPSGVFEVDKIPWEDWSKPDFQIPTRSSWDDVVKIPEDRRVREVLTLANAEKRHVDLTLIMCAGDDAGSFGNFRVESVEY